MLYKVEIDNSKCPICGKPTYISKDDYACSDINCPFSIGDKAYMNEYSCEDYMQHQIDDYNRNIKQ